MTERQRGVLELLQATAASKVSSDVAVLCTYHILSVTRVCGDLEQLYNTLIL